MCGQPLTAFSRVPVCTACLQSPEPLQADYCCSICRAPFLTTAPLDAEHRCGLCRRGVQGFQAAYAFGFYEGRLRGLIHLFKYARVHTLDSVLGRLLMRALPREQRFDAVVPLPLHWRRRWERGFNQAELLARVVSRHTGWPVLQAVRRARRTRTQAGLSNAQRRTNVSRAFQVPQPDAVRGRRILLIDDVLTTGATAAACAAALRLAGADYVAVLTLARVDRRRRWRDEAAEEVGFR